MWSSFQARGVGGRARDLILQARRRVAEGDIASRDENHLRDRHHKVRIPDRDAHEDFQIPGERAGRVLPMGECVAATSPKSD